MGEEKKIQSVERIFQIIEVLAKERFLGVVEISEKVALHKSTTYRFLKELVNMGYAEKNRETGKYGLTFKILGIAGQVLKNMDLVEVARPYLEELVRKSKETVHLVQREQNDIIYIDKIEAHINSIRMISHVGLRKPMVCTAVGKSILASMSLEEVNRIWKETKISSYTRHTITDFDVLIKELEDVRKVGYAMDNEENEKGVKCIAACIFDYMGRSISAFSISAPVSRMDYDRVIKLSGYVLETKRAVSLALGYKPEEEEWV